MRKIAALSLAGFFAIAISPTHAQAPATSTMPAPAASTTPGTSTSQAPSAESGLPTEIDLKTFTDMRVEVIKAALQLTPQQAQLWPPVEEAIRARAMSRRARLAKFLAEGPRERTPIDFMQQRADVLAQRATNLKKLADAWQPLYATLDDRQKLRLGVLAVYALREMRSAVESRVHAMHEDDED